MIKLDFNDDGDKAEGTPATREEREAWGLSMAKEAVKVREEAMEAVMDIVAKRNYPNEWTSMAMMHSVCCDLFGIVTKTLCEVEEYAHIRGAASKLADAIVGDSLTALREKANGK